MNPEQQSTPGASQYPGQDYSQPQQPLPPEPVKVRHILDKNMIIPIVVIILLSIAGIFLYSYLNTPKEDAVRVVATQIGVKETATADVEPDFLYKKPTYCTEKVSNGEFPSEDDCFAALAVQNYNRKYCFGIEDQAGKDDCFRKIAYDFNDIDSCSELSIERGTGSVTECLFTLAKDGEQSAPCFDIPYEDGEFSQSHCFFEVAKLQQNEDLCGTLVNSKEPYTEEKCLEAVQASLKQ